MGESEPRKEHALTAFIKDVGWIYGLSVGVASAGPLASIATNIGPPVPSTAELLTFTALADLVVVIGVFVWRDAATFPFRLHVIVLGVVATVALMAVYGTLADRYIVHGAGTIGRVVVGKEYKPEIKQLLSEPGRETDPAALLEKFGPPTEVWTPESVRSARRELFLIWISFWATFSFTVSYALTGLKPLRSENLGVNSRPRLASQ